MITSDVSVYPVSAAEAYSMYKSADSAVFVAGAQHLKSRQDHYDIAVDLSKAKLKTITDLGDEVSIGAMVNFSQLGSSKLIKELAGGAITRFIASIKDDELKRHGTLGGVMAVKNPFSPLLTIFMTLHVDVMLEDKGRMDLRDYIDCPPMHEMITHIVVAKEPVYTAYKLYQHLPTDEPYLTGAVALIDDEWRIVVGGRPGRPAIAYNASDELTEKGMAVRENVAHMVSEEMAFGDYGTCSEKERRALTIEMIRTLIKDAWKGHNKMLQANEKK